MLKNIAGGAGANDPSAGISFHQHQRNFEDFVRAVGEGREPSSSALSARPAVALIEAIYRSSREGGRRVLI
jgi:predicted dehydrogenase